MSRPRMNNLTNRANPIEWYKLVMSIASHDGSFLHESRHGHRSRFERLDGNLCLSPIDSIVNFAEIARTQLSDELEITTIDLVGAHRWSNNSSGNLRTWFGETVTQSIRCHGIVLNQVLKLHERSSRGNVEITIGPGVNLVVFHVIQLESIEVTNRERVCTWMK